MKNYLKIKIITRKTYFQMALQTASVLWFEIKTVEPLTGKQRKKNSQCLRFFEIYNFYVIQ